ncbi:hypothetical protein [Archangium lansingense]|uniref:Lipoprotein n=1 Tax=Archangium lansingense TaxID=2995310 RepID=A0ABT4A2Q3_9BACT|nr:hypothetical protein [Archangium lansinium]MCY1075559.1 hypothetical protein [Archangium lansinium]
MKYPLILTILLTSSCALFPKPPPEDPSIRFPNFYENFATIVGKQGQPYELDGVTLRAISIAANDFIPPGYKSRWCWDRQESHLYRVIRQGDIIFVDISANPRACEQKVMVLDGGAKYAISTDGRILRRLFDGEPEDLNPASETTAQEPRGTPVPESQVGGLFGRPDPNLPSSWFDGGTRHPTPESPPTPPAPDSPDAGSPVPDGGTQAPDGGSPGVPSPVSPPDAG